MTNLDNNGWCEQMENDPYRPSSGDFRIDGLMREVAELRQQLAEARAAAQWMFWKLRSWDRKESLARWSWCKDESTRDTGGDNGIH